MGVTLRVEEVRPGLCKVIVVRNGREQSRQVLADNLIDRIMDAINAYPMLGRDITRIEALEKLGLKPKQKGEK